MKIKWSKAKMAWYKFWMSVMKDDMRFCLCGCSPWYWSLWRVVRKYVLWQKCE